MKIGKYSIYSLAAKNIEHYQVLLIPSLYYSVDDKDDTVSVGVAFLGAYAEICITKDDETN